jgi:hypothetical protein
MSDGPFTTAAYKRLLDSAKRNGYRFAFFDEEPGVDRVVYLRHDIDNSIDSAVSMARLEAGCGVLATYFVMLRSPNYNVLAFPSLEGLHTIVSLGHRLGLHHVATGTTRADDIREDADLLARVTGAPIDVFSFHNPSMRGDHRVEVPGLVNAYSPPFVERARYVSESGMRWKSLPPDELFAEEGAPAYQVLVHPMSYAADLRTNRDVLVYFLRQKVLELKELNESENHELSQQRVPMSVVATALIEERP